MQHIPACGSLRNLLLTISYDGKEFHGWQIQQNAMTVQEAFQTALSKIIGNDFDVKLNKINFTLINNELFRNQGVNFW